MSALRDREYVGDRHRLGVVGNRQNQIRAVYTPRKVTRMDVTAIEHYVINLALSAPSQHVYRAMVLSAPLGRHARSLA